MKMVEKIDEDMEVRADLEGKYMENTKLED